MILTGIIIRIDEYNKLRIKITDPVIISRLNTEINEKYNKPYKEEINNSLECIINIDKYKEYYMKLINDNIGKQIIVNVISKRYSFNGKRGTSLYMQTIDILD